MAFTIHKKQRDGTKMDGIEIVDGTIVNAQVEKVVGNILIPEGITEIKSLAFCWCEKLTGITLPASITFIGHHAFRECRQLTNIYIPDKVHFIGYRAFYRCSNLSFISIPKGIEIGLEAFAGCPEKLKIEQRETTKN